MYLSLPSKSMSRKTETILYKNKEIRKVLGFIVWQVFWGLLDDPCTSPHANLFG